MTAMKCSEEVLAAAEENNTFMLSFHPHLYQRLKHPQSGNIFYSGISASTLLTMMWETFRNKNGKPSLDYLNFLKVNPLKSQLVTPGFAEVMRDYARITYGPNDAVLSIANRMYTDSTLGALDPNFLATVHGDYKCNHVALSFANVQQAAERINADFARDTNDLVDDVVTEEQLDIFSKIVLASSLYFRGVWEVPFNPEDTVMKQFTRIDNKSVTVPMMIKRRAPGMSYTNFRDMASHACAMYFEGQRFCLIVVRPSRSGRDLVRYMSPNMETNLSPVNLIAHFKRYHRKSRRGEGGLLVNIELPRFQISSRHMINRALGDMGNTSPWKTGRMPTFPDAFQSLPANSNPSVTQVIQKCQIVINETGATHEESKAPLLPPRPSWKARPKCVKMIVDRTFYFVLFDYTNNFLIAAGLIDDPTSVN